MVRIAFVVLFLLLPVKSDRSRESLRCNHLGHNSHFPASAFATILHRMAVGYPLMVRRHSEDGARREIRFNLDLLLRARYLWSDIEQPLTEELFDLAKGNGIATRRRGTENVLNVERIAQSAEARDLAKGHPILSCAIASADSPPFAVGSHHPVEPVRVEQKTKDAEKGEQRKSADLQKEYQVLADRLAKEMDEHFQKCVFKVNYGEEFIHLEDDHSKIVNYQRELLADMEDAYFYLTSPILQLALHQVVDGLKRAKLKQATAFILEKHRTAVAAWRNLMDYKRGEFVLFLEASWVAIKKLDDLSRTLAIVASGEEDIVQRLEQLESKEPKRPEKAGKAKVNADEILSRIPNLDQLLDRHRDLTMRQPSDDLDEETERQKLVYEEIELLFHALSNALKTEKKDANDKYVLVEGSIWQPQSVRKFELPDKIIDFLAKNKDRAQRSVRTLDYIREMKEPQNFNLVKGFSKYVERYRDDARPAVYEMWKAFSEGIRWIAHLDFGYKLIKFISTLWNLVKKKGLSPYEKSEEAISRRDGSPKAGEIYQKIQKDAKSPAIDVSKLMYIEMETLKKIIKQHLDGQFEGWWNRVEESQNHNDLFDKFKTMKSSDSVFIDKLVDGFLLAEPVRKIDEYYEKLRRKNKSPAGDASQVQQIGESELAEAKLFFGLLGSTIEGNSDQPFKFFQRVGSGLGHNYKLLREKFEQELPKQLANRRILDFFNHREQIFGWSEEFRQKTAFFKISMGSQNANSEAKKAKKPSKKYIPKYLYRLRARALRWKYGKRWAEKLPEMEGGRGERGGLAKNTRFISDWKIHSVYRGQKLRREKENEAKLDSARLESLNGPGAAEGGTAAVDVQEQRQREKQSLGLIAAANGKKTVVLFAGLLLEQLARNAKDRLGELVPADMDEKVWKAYRESLREVHEELEKWEGRDPGEFYWICRNLNEEQRKRMETLLSAYLSSGASAAQCVSTIMAQVAATEDYLVGRVALARKRKWKSGNRG